MEELNYFGVWYFDTGWLIATAIAFALGLQCKTKWHISSLCISVLAIGVFALYCKHGI